MTYEFQYDDQSDAPITLTVEYSTSKYGEVFIDSIKDEDGRESEVSPELVSKIEAEIFDVKPTPCEMDYELYYRYDDMDLGGF